MDRTNKLRGLIRVLREDAGDGLEVQQVACLIEVMADHPDPITHSEIEGRVGLAQSSVSRNMKRLSVRMRQDTNGKWIDAGLGLVDVRPDAYETRKLSASLTKKGINLMNKMKGVI